MNEETYKKLHEIDKLVLSILNFRAFLKFFSGKLRINLKFPAPGFPLFHQVGSDVAARFAADEFVIILPETKAENALNIKRNR